MWEYFRSLGDLYCRRTLCTRWGRDRLGNYPCLMNTKIRIWLKSTEMARQQVRDAPGELWAAQIYPQAFLKMFFFFFLNQHSWLFWAENAACTQRLPLPSPLTLMLRGQLSASVGFCHIGHSPMSTAHGAQWGSISPLLVTVLLVESSKKNHSIAIERMLDWKGS